MRTRLFTIALAAAAAVLAGCANKLPGLDMGPGGKHLVYRDAAGAMTRQFDYPTEDACRRVESVAGGARCQADSASTQLQAQAVLRYNPPGFNVQAHYADMNRCQTDTARLGQGVELVSGCTPK